MKAKIWSKKYWIHNTEPKILKQLFTDLLIKSGFNIEGQIEKHFYPYGYTCLWLLSESHLAIHTFPEENKTYIEISSCVYSKYKTFIKLMETK